MHINLKSLLWLLLFSLLIGLESCVTAYQSAYRTNKKDIYINLNEHNLEYMLPQDTRDSLFKQEHIDQFDREFFGALQYNLEIQDFPDTCSGKMGIVSLKNCMIDFKILPNYPKEFRGDTLYINYMQANLICKSEEVPGGLFYSFANIPENYSVLILNKNDTIQNDSLPWKINEHFRYLHQGFNSTLMNSLAFKLATQTAINIDSLAKYDFYFKHPDLAD